MKRILDVVVRSGNIVVISNFLVFSLLNCSIHDSPGNYDLIDKFLGGSTARKCVFSKGEQRRNDILFYMNI